MKEGLLKVSHWGYVYPICSFQMSSNFLLSQDGLLNNSINFPQTGPTSTYCSSPSIHTMNLIFYLLIIEIPKCFIQYLTQMDLIRHQTPNIHSPFASLQLQLKIPFKISQVGLRSSNKYQRDGHWNQKQRLKYVIFLSFFQSLFLDQDKKKMVRIYQMMSDMIVTRNSNQCRSHHQKMIKYRNTICEIINSVAEKYEPSLFRDLRDKYLVFIKNILLNQAKYLRVSTEAQKTRYIETCIDFNATTIKGNVKIQPLEQNEICFKGLQQQKADKEIEDRRKTRDEYLPISHYMDQQSPMHQIQIIDMPDLKLEEEQQYHLPHKTSNNQVLTNNQQMGVQGLFSVQEGGLMLTAQGRSYYQSQIQMLSTKRQWHTHNIQQLNAQIINQKQSINYCDSTIKLYSLALNNHKKKEN